MAGLLGALSAHLNKSLVTGALLPALLFVLGLKWLVMPLLPTNVGLAAIGRLGPEWQILVLVIATAGLSVLLHDLNTPLIRLYEGYLWEDSWIGQWRKRKHQNRFDSLVARWSGMRTATYALQRLVGQQPAVEGRLTAMSNRWRDIGLVLNENFPSRRDSVMPTRLGNAIRSFESYAKRQYRMAGVSLWPRLVSVLDKEYASVIEDAKIRLDFTLYLSFLSGLLAATLLIVGLAFPESISQPFTLSSWAVYLLVLLLTSWAMYGFAVGSAVSWGYQVRGAFDLYRWSLLEKLGFREPPRTLEEERELWDDISAQLIYGDSPRVELPAYRSDKTFISSAPRAPLIRVVKGIYASATKQSGCVHLAVRNDDRRLARNVVVVDTLPDGLSYEWNSLAGPAGVRLMASAPMRIAVGDLGPGAQVEVTFRVVGFGTSSGQ